MSNPLWMAWFLVNIHPIWPGGKRLAFHGYKKRVRSLYEMKPGVLWKNRVQWNKVPWGFGLLLFGGIEFLGRCRMMRIFLGLLKGLMVGGGVGCLFFYLEPSMGSFYPILCYLAAVFVGAVVGFVCGRAPWRTETFWVPALRVVLGAILAPLFYGLGHAFLPAVSMVTFSSRVLSLHSFAFLITAIGMIYGLFVELDDGGAASSKT